MTEFQRKAGRIYPKPSERDVHGKREALPSEIMLQMRGMEGIHFQKFPELEPFYQPVNKDVEKKTTSQRGKAIYDERMRKKKK